MPHATPHLAAPELTRHQSLVLDALAREANPASAYTLLDHLREEGLRAPQQVYRALDKLIEYGLVHRVESLNSFIACPHPHNHGTGQEPVVFAICERCGHVDEFTDQAIARRLKGWCKEQAFDLHTAAVEMHGTCARCAAAGGAEVA